MTPVAQHVRRVPIALQEKVEQRLKELLESDIIEPVNNPSAWVSPLVIVLKDNGEPRICVDMRRANAAIRRENHPIPTIEDALHKLAGARVFSRLDVKDAFHQVELSEESRHITTFICHKGMFRYKRLMFGVSTASEVFQKMMEQILSGLKGVFVLHDDLLVHGSTMKEHDENLKAVLETLRRHGVLLNVNKCKFRVKETTFFGHKFSEHGVEPTEERIEAIMNCRQPESAEEVRSFLGMISYIGSFIPHLSTRTHKLRELTTKETKFEWTPEHGLAFKQIKESVAAITRLSFFIPGRAREWSQMHQR